MRCWLTLYLSNYTRWVLLIAWQPCNYRAGQLDYGRAHYVCSHVLLWNDCEYHCPLIITSAAQWAVHKPLGRIMNRFTKGSSHAIFACNFGWPVLDVDTLDNLLGGYYSHFHPLIAISQAAPDSLRMFACDLSSIFSGIILISIVLPWFLLPVFFVVILYIYAAAFYRASARELKVRPPSCWIVNQTYTFCSSDSVIISDSVFPFPIAYLDTSRRGAEVFFIFPFLRKPIWTNHNPCLWWIRAFQPRKYQTSWCGKPVFFPVIYIVRVA